MLKFLLFLVLKGCIILFLSLFRSLTLVPSSIDTTHTLYDFTAGILLHYDDPNQDLQDLYFIDPKWLCQLMARVVTLPVVNPYILNGVWDLSNLPMLFRGEQFAHHNSPQFIRLLNRFQIACSLDDNRVLIPSKLPAEKPEQATSDDLPFITLKRIHSMPCIPHGFWSRLISRLLFYMKDMLSGGENVTRKECSSPFQLDPFCCRCPLVFENLTLSKDSGSQLLGTTEPSLAGSFENLADPSVEFQGVRFFGAPRQGTFINGRFFCLSAAEGRISRSDSGYEYSSEDDEEAHGESHPLNSSFPFRLSRGHLWRTKGIFKHGTDPGVGRKNKVNEPEEGSPCSDSAFPITSRRFKEDVLSGTSFVCSSALGSSDGSCVTIPSERRGLSVDHGESSLPESTLQGLNCIREISGLQDLSQGPEVLVLPDTAAVIADGDVIQEMPPACSDRTSFEPCPKSTDDCPVFSASQDGDNVISPYQSAISESPDTSLRELTNRFHTDIDPTSAKSIEDVEVNFRIEDLYADGLPVFQQSGTETEMEGQNNFFSSSRTSDSSSSNSIPSDKESSGDGESHAEDRRSSGSETQESFGLIQGPRDPEEHEEGNIQSIEIKRICVHES